MGGKRKAHLQPFLFIFCCSQELQQFTPIVTKKCCSARAPLPLYINAKHQAAHQRRVSAIPGAAPQYLRSNIVLFPVNASTLGAACNFYFEPFLLEMLSRFLNTTQTPRRTSSHSHF